MKKYEYEISTVIGDVGQLRDEIQRRADEGWRISSIQNPNSMRYHVLCEREVVSESPIKFTYNLPDMDKKTIEALEASNKAHREEMDKMAGNTDAMRGRRPVSASDSADKLTDILIEHQNRRIERLGNMLEFLCNKTEGMAIPTNNTAKEVGKLNAICRWHEKRKESDGEVQAKPSSDGS